MRLRSTQFVFLLLLVCSVQHREQCALHLLSSDISGQAANEPQRSTIAAAAAARPTPALQGRDPYTREIRLDAASLAAHSTVWTVRRPARESAAVSSFTGFRRA